MGPRFRGRRAMRGTNLVEAASPERAILTIQLGAHKERHARRG